MPAGGEEEEVASEREEEAAAAVVAHWVLSLAGDRDTARVLCSDAAVDTSAEEEEAVVVEAEARHASSDDCTRTHTDVVLVPAACEDQEQCSGDKAAMRGPGIQDKPFDGAQAGD